MSKEIRKRKAKMKINLDSSQIEELEVDEEINQEPEDNIKNIKTPKNQKPKREKKKDFEILFPEEILEVLEKIIKSQNRDLLNIVGQDSAIDYSKFKKCQKEDKKVLLKC